MAARHVARDALKLLSLRSESAMMDAQRYMRLAKAGGDKVAGQLHVNKGIEEFIQEITMRAIAGKLEPGETAEGQAWVAKEKFQQ